MEEGALLAYLSDAIKSSMQNLNKIWVDMGYAQKDVESRRDSVCNHVTGILQDMVVEEEEFKNSTIAQIEGYLQDASALSKDLHMAVPMDCDANLPLLEMKRMLCKKLERFAAVKAERLEQLTALRQREEELIEVLGIPSRVNNFGNVPSEEQLQQYDEYLRSKMEDKVRLQGIFHATRLAIIAITEEMGIKPDLEFEARVLVGAPVQLSADNMAALKEFHQSLERRLEEVKALTTELREKLTLLWDRLNESYEQRSAFLVLHTGHSANTVKALRQEIKRCEVLKRENIKHFVEVVRRELQDWWSKCCYSDEQRAEFRHFTSDCFTEDLLELHEQEVHRLTEFYQANSHIFQLMKERQDLWERMTVLEEEATHPNRLFGNRGGQLLLEEKERKTIQRKMPKIEAELSKHVEKYETENARPFLINGERITEFLENQWCMHKENKEKEKQARKLRNQTTAGETRSACKSTVGVSMKRKIATPGASNTKRGRIALDTEEKVSTAKPQRPVRDSEKEKEKEKQQRIKKVNRKIFNTTRKVETAAAADPDLTSYMDFQNHLEKGAKSSRSSAKIPVRCLRERNQIPSAPQAAPVARRVATPLKTPLKPAMSLAGRNTPGSRVNATPRLIQTPTGFARTPRFTPARGNLPFII